MKELPKICQPDKYEDEIYRIWEESGFFNPDNLPSKRKHSFNIALPLPNVTGKLHIGHASMLSYQDIMARYHRLKGDKTLWLPGMDHAAIATQNVVEKELNGQGRNRHDLGREKFLEEVNKFVGKAKVIIRNQLKKMGSSLDWSREKFTLDADLSKTVRYVFKKMHDDNLIYQGDRVVNWCTRCQSTLSDDEVEYEASKGKLYFIKYGPVVVATTRPETKLGDTGIAVNPKDKRYKELVGRELEIDLAGHGLKVKVFADRAVDMSFGTGAIGVTPAHSQQDFAWAEQYGLPVVKVINEQGKMTELAGKYQGLAVEECRKRLVKDLDKAGLIEKIEDYSNNLSLCYRCGSAIEPLTSKQWFVAVNRKIPGRGKSLKELASEMVKEGKIQIIPDRFNKTYFQWMDNLRDWCISRQIWYGHRIPVWYRGEELFVGLEAPLGEGWLQDEDTLDTWFSSSLWTFSTLGWPEKTQDLKDFHPTSVMETGYDILFFWVARMIMMSAYLLGEKPFSTVYLHGLVRDKEGRKMSKSAGNGIDPLDMIAKFGTDALRLSMVIGASAGNDIRLYEEKIAGYRNFVNKLWNISRYILTSVGQVKRVAGKPRVVSLADKWILSEFDRIIKSTAGQIEEFRFSSAGEELYEFTRSKLADWYLEIAKLEGNKDEILLYVLERLLILWHPFCPFVTEALWQNFNSGELLMVQAWPETNGSRAGTGEFGKVQELVTAVRNARSEHLANPKKTYICSIDAFDRKLVERNKQVIEGLGRIKITPKATGVNIHLAWADLTLDIKENMEVARTKAKETGNLERYIQIQERKMANKEFIKKAPQPVIEAERLKLQEAREKLSKLK